MVDLTPEEKVAMLEKKLAELKGQNQKSGIVSWYVREVLYEGLTMPDEGDELLLAYNSAKTDLRQWAVIAVLCFIVFVALVF